MLSIAVGMLVMAFSVGPGAAPAKDARGSSTHSYLLPAEPPAAEVCAGDPAPNFAYQGYDGRWMRLHHLLDQERSCS